MNHKSFPLIKQAGMTLVEVMASIFIFAILMLGSGLLLTKSLKIQKESNVTQVITNILQQRLQAAANTPMVQTCSAINLDNFEIGAITYYVGCGTANTTINSTNISWPVLAVSSQSNDVAEACATGSASDPTACYIVGK